MWCLIEVKENRFVFTQPHLHKPDVTQGKFTIKVKLIWIPFSFSLPSCLTKVNETSLPYYLFNLPYYLHMKVLPNFQLIIGYLFKIHDFYMVGLILWHFNSFWLFNVRSRSLSLSLSFSLSLSLFIYIYIYMLDIYVFDSWNLDCNPWVSLI